MYSHDLLPDVAYPVTPVVDNGKGGGAQPVLRCGPSDATATDITVGSTVLGTCGETIGTIGEVYYDNQTGRSDWATVSIGRHRCVIPLSEARVDGNTVWVLATAQQVRAAPHRDPATALTVEDKHDLDRHFRITDPHRGFVRRVAPQARLLGEPAKTARHGHAHRARDSGPNLSRTRMRGVTVCPPEALRC